MLRTRLTLPLVIAVSIVAVVGPSASSAQAAYVNCKPKVLEITSKNFSSNRNFMVAQGGRLSVDGITCADGYAVMKKYMLFRVGDLKRAPTGYKASVMPNTATVLRKGDVKVRAYLSGP